MALELLEVGQFNQQMKTSSDLSLLHLNIRSLQKHYDELHVLNASLKHSFHVIALSETWLSNGADAPYPLPGYQLEVANRSNLLSDKLRTASSHGGVALYINASVSYSVRRDIVITSDLCESLFIEVQPDRTTKGLLPHKTKKTLVGVVYRSPLNKIEHFLQELGKLLDTYIEPNIHVILLGDINIDVAQKDSNNYSYTDLLAREGLLQLITSATRTTSSRQSILDHIITSHPSPIFVTGTISCDITDHLPVFAISNPANQTTKNKVTRTFYDKKQIFHSLARENWQEMYSASSTEEKYNAFINRDT